MAELHIGQVEKITGVKSHVLRYWEKHLSMISQKKDQFGRRVYSMRDVQILLRIKYFIENKKFTLEGACQKLLEEQTSCKNELARSLLAQIKGELLNVYLKLQNGES